MTLSRLVRGSMIAFLPALAIASGCSSDRTTEPTAKNGAKIIGGTTDTTNTWVVGIDIGGFGICSGSLIAPNLVLTARHCVSQTAESIDCRPDAGLNDNKVYKDYSASTFRVTTAQDIRNGPSWGVAAVRTIDDPLASRVCGYDFALLELKKNTSGAYPTKWMAPSNVPPKKHAYTAIGYGCQAAEPACDPRGFRMLLEPVSVVEVDAQDFVVSGRVCGGDSGGPIWNSTANVIYGALSRGDASTSTMEGCNFGIYTRTDVHWAWLQKWGHQAATDGGYAPLPWMDEPLPPPDAGVDSAPPPPTGELGSTCTTPADCKSNLCIDYAGKKTCSQACTAAKPCPTGFACESGYCVAATDPPPDPATDDAGDVDAVVPAADDQPGIKSSTCNLGAAPPPKPQPWYGLAAAAGIAAVLVARRRR